MTEELTLDAIVEQISSLAESNVVRIAKLDRSRLPFPLEILIMQLQIEILTLIVTAHNDEHRARFDLALELRIASMLDKIDSTTNGIIVPELDVPSNIINLDDHRKDTE